MHRELIIGAIAFFALAGCASRPLNQPLDSVDVSSGYRGNVVVPRRPGA